MACTVVYRHFSKIYAIASNCCNILFSRKVAALLVIHFDVHYPTFLFLGFEICTT